MSLFAVIYCNSVYHRLSDLKFSSSYMQDMEKAKLAPLLDLGNNARGSGDDSFPCARLLEDTPRRCHWSISSLPLHYITGRFSWLCHTIRTHRFTWNQLFFDSTHIVLYMIGLDYGAVTHIYSQYSTHRSLQYLHIIWLSLIFVPLSLCPVAFKLSRNSTQYSYSSRLASNSASTTEWSPFTVLQIHQSRVFLEFPSSSSQGPFITMCSQNNLPYDCKCIKSVQQ